MVNRTACAPPSAEPKNKHEPWCNIWTTLDKPCNCGGKK